ncbi:AMP-binding protein [Magnetococcus sp. PR-3]|uniref:AMP-binding protein n=1 Tax=Magnetococcus sp. PR-3 TaxID=3120355 RepID=UPI002FCE4C30
MNVHISGSKPEQGPCLFLLHNETTQHPATLLQHLPKSCAGIQFTHEGVIPSSASWPGRNCFRLNAHSSSRWGSFLTFLNMGGHALCNAHNQAPAPGGFDRLAPEVVALAAQLDCPIQPVALFQTWNGQKILHFGTLFTPQSEGEPLHHQLVDQLRKTRLAGTLEQPPHTIWGAAQGALMQNKGQQFSDSTGLKLDGPTLLRNSRILATLLAQETPKDSCIGLMLPSSIGSMVTLLALTATGRIPALLNFTAGPRGMLSACKTADIQTILTSRAFVKKAGLESTVEPMQAHVQILFLEDLKAEITLAHKLRGLSAHLMYDRLGRSEPKTKIGTNDPAVVLFTSGSEGRAKGVVLSHGNLLANVQQIALSVPLYRHDRYLNTLPMFHAFGLTVGTLTPILTGMHLHQHPSPLAQQAICHLGRSYRPTVMAGTDTFLANYVRTAKAGDFSSIRFVFAGAEPVRSTTIAQWQTRFGVTVYQGYGATECSPVISVNTPGANRPESVGRPVAGITCRTQPVEGIHQGGRLQVKGPNVMMGYLNAKSPGHPKHAQRPPMDEEGWYDTGDIVILDKLGAITIDGRAKRFAKVGGEMVSLAAVERLATRLWPDHQHAAMRLPSEKKGEWVLLFSETPACSRESLLNHAQQEGSPLLLVPRRVVHVDTLPMLANGKVDHAALAQMAHTLKA